MNARLSAALVAALGFTLAGAATDGPVVLQPGQFPKLGSIDPRFQSFNIEMIEVTGGAFWKPYGAGEDAAKVPTPEGMDPKLYSYRPPKDLSNPRLRKLAVALAPTYVRVSGTWANTTYFADTDKPPKEPPPGFKGVLTRAEWKGVIDFSRIADAKIITSFPVSSGSRDTAGEWNSETSKAWLAYTKSIGGTIAAAEFMNEPNLAYLAGLPAYDAPAYGRDSARFAAFLKQYSPKTLLLAPGAAGASDAPPSRSGVIAPGNLVASMGAVDIVSYHHYGDVSARCHGHQSEANALSESWLATTGDTAAYYLKQRDTYAPGKPVWLSEVGDAACGGNPWASTFLDSFRYLDQLGRLAKMGVSVVAHNTLAISDYGLLEEADYTPRPNYWAAYVWRRLMGAVVLDAGLPTREGLHVYAHCALGHVGAVTLLVINNSRTAETSLQIAGNGTRYTLSADKLNGKEVKLNGVALALGPKDALPVISGVSMKSGMQHFAPATMSFLVIPGTGNTACR